MKEKMRLVPHTDRICIKKLDVPEKSSGIIVPTAVAEKMQRATVIGEVVAVGPLVQDVKVGDNVMFSHIVPWSIPETPALADYKGHVILNEEDIFAFLDGGVV